MRQINEYFSQDEKISLISEYLISKNKAKNNKRPKFGCELEDIKNWFKKLGVSDEEIFYYEFGTSHNPGYPGEISVIFCAKNNDNNKYWVSLACKTEKRKIQEVCIKPKSESFYTPDMMGGTADRRYSYIDFETALDIAEYMLSNRGEEINLDDFKK